MCHHHFLTMVKMGWDLLIFLSDNVLCNPAGLFCMDCDKKLLPGHGDTTWYNPEYEYVTGMCQCALGWQNLPQNVKMHPVTLWQQGVLHTVFLLAMFLFLFLFLDCFSATSLFIFHLGTCVCFFWWLVFGLQCCLVFSNHCFAREKPKKSTYEWMDDLFLSGMCTIFLGMQCNFSIWLPCFAMEI